MRNLEEAQKQIRNEAIQFIREKIGEYKSLRAFARDYDLDHGNLTRAINGNTSRLETLLGIIKKVTEKDDGAAKNKRKDKVKR